MFCANCGNQIEGTMAFCPKCGTPVGGRQAVPVAGGEVEVKSHMLGAILQLVICVPAGIVPLIYACKVNQRLAQGDIVGAQEASKKALFWINVGTAIVGTLIVLWLIGNVVAGR